MKRNVVTRDGLRSGDNIDKALPAKGARENGGRGAGRGTGRGSSLARATSQDDSEAITKNNEATLVNEGTDVEMVDNLNLLEQGRSLEVIQEDTNMEDRTMHSGDTVRQGNVPDTRSTRLSINLFVPPSDDRPDKVLIEACKNGTQRC